MQAIRPALGINWRRRSEGQVSNNVRMWNEISTPPQKIPIYSYRPPLYMGQPESHMKLSKLLFHHGPQDSFVLSCITSHPALNL